MTREIKFKFWDKDLNKMCERKPAHNDFSHPNIIPLQFTGLKDKKGKEIYEGDCLVDIEVELEEGVKLKDTAQQVYWSAKKGAWMLDETFKQNKKKGTLLSKNLDVFDFEIIGNIYQK